MQSTILPLCGYRHKPFGFGVAARLRSCLLTLLETELFSPAKKPEVKRGYLSLLDKEVYQQAYLSQLFSAKLFKELQVPSPHQGFICNIS